MDTPNALLPPPRLNALDNLRATMMWLGIVLHVAVNHLSGETPMPWRDRDTTPLADLLVAFIHAFRMPVFFIVAGFFAALLIERRGLGGMLAHRFRRLALPFLLFWPPILLGVMLLSLLYMHRIARGSFGLDATLLPAMPHTPMPNTMHLWFLYLLWWLVVVTVALGWCVQRLPRSWRAGMARIPAALAGLGGARGGALVLALPLVLAGLGYPHGLHRPSGSLLPLPSEWLHNGLFFGFGLVLHGARVQLLPLYARRWATYLAAGLPFFLATIALVGWGQRHGPVAHEALIVAWAYNTCGWLWCFGLIGLFLRWLPQRRAVLAYLAESAYWVYLLHLLCTIGFGAVLHGLPIGAVGKMLLNIGLTTAVCLTSYHLLVRGRWLGRLLNGAPPGPEPAGAGLRGVQA